MLSFTAKTVSRCAEDIRIRNSIIEIALDDVQLNPNEDCDLGWAWNRMSCMGVLRAFKATVWYVRPFMTTAPPHFKCGHCAYPREHASTLMCSVGEWALLQTQGVTSRECWNLLKRFEMFLSSMLIGGRDQHENLNGYHPTSIQWCALRFWGCFPAPLENP